MSPDQHPQLDAVRVRHDLARDRGHIFQCAGNVKLLVPVQVFRLFLARGLGFRFGEQRNAVVKREVRVHDGALFDELIHRLLSAR
ncbi:MAG: hypothetical protein M9935_08565 [Kiritimatiellae bacterium]|nr:hypothetical protein [Kiritimatiellia bacterium]